MLKQNYQGFFLVIMLAVFVFGQEHYSGEKGGVKLTVYEITGDVFFSDKDCYGNGIGVPVGVLVSLENRNKESVVEIEPDNFEFRNIKTGETYSAFTECPIVKRYSQLQMLNGTVDYGENVKGWISFKVTTQFRVEDVEIRYKLETIEGTMIIKCRWGVTPPASKPQTTKKKK